MKLDLVIVDDSPLWLSIAAKLAENHPLIGKVTTFQDSIDAWVHIQNSKPHIVMTDIEMPGMDGFSFLQMFGNSIPFISSSTREAYAIIAKDLGCTGFINKPFGKSEFYGVIETACSKLSNGIKLGQPLSGPVRA